MMKEGIELILWHIPVILLAHKAEAMRIKGWGCNLVVKCFLSSIPSMGEGQGRKGNQKR